jgi:hypothetical protein
MNIPSMVAARVDLPRPTDGDRTAQVRAAYIAFMAEHGVAPTMDELEAATGITKGYALSDCISRLVASEWLAYVGNRRRCYVPAGARDAAREWAKTQR